MTSYLNFMKTLIKDEFYQMTDDIAVIYRGDVIPVTDDGHQNWCIVANNAVMMLTTFEVDGVLWYFTNDYQELEISQFVTEQLPQMGIAYADIEWVKTLPDPLEEWNYQVYFKLREQQSFHSIWWKADNEESLIKLLQFPEYISFNGDTDEWRCLCGNTAFEAGFYTCDNKGHEMEPLIGSQWNGLYVCGECGRVIDGDTLKVVARKIADNH